MKKDAVIIISGGMDSCTMLYEFKDEIALAITFDYGSTQNGRERVCAVTHCQRLGIKHLIIPLEFMHRYFKSALLGSPEDIPDGNYNDENMKSTVVPFRNGIMLAIACGIAESNGLKRVMIANHSGDHSIYPDCRPAFVDAMSAAMKAGTYEGIEGYSPTSTRPRLRATARHWVSTIAKPTPATRVVKRTAALAALAPSVAKRCAWQVSTTKLFMNQI